MKNIAGLIGGAAAWQRRWLVLATVFIGAGGCGGGSSSGGERVIVAPSSPTAPPPPQCQTFVVDKDDSGASDDNNGRPVAEGGTGPWHTIAHALDSAEPCDTVRIRATATPYQEATNASTLPGIVISRSGEAGRPIIIEGFPGERPVIDQQQTAAGFLLQCASWITLRNIEIRNVAEAGVSTSLDGCSSNHLIMENLVIHGVQGGNLVAGIRLADVSDVSIHNNRLYNIEKVRSDDGTFLSESEGPSERIEIAQNTVNSVDNSVLISLQSSSLLSGLTIHHNRFSDGIAGIGLLAGNSDGVVSDVEIFGNIIYDVENFIDAAPDSTSNSSGPLRIHNNTFARNNGTALVFDRFIGIFLVNNILFHVDENVLEVGNEARFDAIDYNLYAPASASWTLGSTTPRTYNTLTDWQSAYSTETPPALLNDPDVHSLAADPLFIDGDRSDFRLQPISPAIHSGGNGVSRGAYFDDNAVGATP